MSKIEDITNKTESHVLHTYGRFGLSFESGKACTLISSDGTSYLDFNSGLGVNALGHVHPEVVGFIKKQAEKVIHTSNLYHIPSQSSLAEKLTSKSFGERVFFCNSGAEAVEGALKFARKYGSLLEKPKTDIVAFENSFHGRTFGALSATMQEKYQKGFRPLIPGFSAAEYNNFPSVEKAVTDATVAIIVEPVQGEGGVNVAGKSFMKSIASLCRERDILLIVDEVQCGMARTGKLFAHEHYGIEPDLMSLAKPLAGGLPIGATIVGPRVWPSINAGEHASTFGGNHFVTGVACGVFDIISNPDFIRDVENKGKRMKKGLKELAGTHACIKDVRGLGLMIGVEVDFPAIEAVKFFENEHILICTAGPNVVRFLPPLIVTEDEIDRVLEVFGRFLGEKCGDKT